MTTSPDLGEVLAELLGEPREEDAWVDDLDPAATLGGLESMTARRRALQVEDLLLVAHWADLHASDPRTEPGANGRRVWAGGSGSRKSGSRSAGVGGDRLVRVGGEGTPRVRELALCELAVARQCHPLAARKVTADVLDLRHRLPLTWARFTTGAVEQWLVCKVAALTRELPHAVVGLVDAAVAACVATESPSRVLAICAAKIIEADPAAHAKRVAAEQARRFVSLTRTDATGLRHVIARVTAGDAAWVDATVDRVADILATQHPDTGRDLLRSQAFGWLGRPAELLQLLLEAAQPEDETQPQAPEAPSRALAFPADLLDTLRAIDPARLRPGAVLYVHLHEAALAGLVPGVARVEDLGPLALTQLRELLGHTQITLKPVIDLRETTSVNAYEHPVAMRERITLRTPGEVFPHATRISRRLDLDHATPYRAQGPPGQTPPGQTGEHNTAPLSRTTHRAKTHLGYHLTQTGPGIYLWRTPHGLHRLVDSHGTHPIDARTAHHLTHGIHVHRFTWRQLQAFRPFPDVT
ncbi:hypothetical protein [Nocardioides pacificus]